jgi:hypothetical protein
VASRGDGWHGEGYCSGEDLLRCDELFRQGRPPKWKWNQVCAETTLIALWLALAHARNLEDAHGGTILVLDLPPDLERHCVMRNPGNFPSVEDRISAKYISGRADAGGFPVPSDISTVLLNPDRHLSV